MLVLIATLSIPLLWNLGPVPEKPSIRHARINHLRSMRSVWYISTAFRSNFHQCCRGSSLIHICPNDPLNFSPSCAANTQKTSRQPVLGIKATHAPSVPFKPDTHLEFETAYNLSSTTRCANLYSFLPSLGLPSIRLLC